MQNVKYLYIYYYIYIYYYYYVYIDLFINFYLLGLVVVQVK